MFKQTGFTLIELMLSLTLGLIITAAAVLLFLTSQRSLSMQQGVSDIQDNANFGLNYLTQDIRLANLNNPKSVVNDETTYGGVVLTSSVNATEDTKTTPPTPLSNLTPSIAGATAAVSLLSGSSMSPSNIQVSGTDALSDQLVIQYIPQYITDDAGNLDGGYDCEGNALKFTAAQGQQVVVQRYFLRTDTNKTDNEPNEALALACDAGHYPKEGDPTAITGYGDNGEIIMKRVDYFRVLLGTQDTDNNRRYMPIQTYMALTTKRPRIVSVQIGLLVRSAQTVGAESVVKDDQSFVVLDQTVTVKSVTSSTKYVRQVVSQTIALRNALGERGETGEE